MTRRGSSGRFIHVFELAGTVPFAEDGENTAARLSPPGRRSPMPDVPVRDR